MRFFVSDALYATTLTIDLSVVADNYRLLQSKLKPGCVAGAAVKADGYGLGAVQVAEAMYEQGCRHFFVAHPHEGMIVRDALPDAGVHVLNGPLPDAVNDYVTAGLTPVLNTLGDIELWRKAAKRLGRQLPAHIHLDTGMCRLGLDLTDTETLLNDSAALLDGIDVRLVMSHLASADDIESPQTAQQLKLFQAASARLSGHRYSLANSSGIFHGHDYHYDVARPGVALYGGNPTPHRANPMGNPVTLTARILQVRTVSPPETVGYGATHPVTKTSKIATVPIGYADGYHRAGSSKGEVHIDGHAAPIVGRVSMDLITLDVTDIPDHLARQGSIVAFMGAHRTPDDLARDWQTIPYEVLTGLGRRYRRVYVGGA